MWNFGGEKEIYSSRIVIIPNSRIISRCHMPIFQGNAKITYDGTRWEWSKDSSALGEIKLYKLVLSD